MGIKRDKKAVNLLSSTVIFVIVNVAFLAMMLLFVRYKADDASIYEQTYSKQIALMIDSAKPGTNVSMDMENLYSIVTKNNLKGNVKIIDIDNTNKVVTVNLKGGVGYSYHFFTDSQVSWIPDNSKKTLYLEIKK